MLSIITGSYLIFWGPLFLVTVWHWSWGWEEAKKSLAHEVLLLAVHHLPVHEGAAERWDEDDRRAVLQVDGARRRGLALGPVEAAALAELLLVPCAAVGGGARPDARRVLLDAAEAHGRVRVVAARSHRATTRERASRDAHRDARRDAQLKAAAIEQQEQAQQVATEQQEEARQAQQAAAQVEGALVSED
jgi:hypothetical protein